MMLGLVWNVMDLLRLIGREKEGTFHKLTH
jgi:hypothetical protein